MKLAFSLQENSVQPLESLRSANPSVDYYPDIVFALSCVSNPCTGMSTPRPWTHVGLGNMEAMSIVSKPTICSTLPSDRDSTSLLFCLMVTPSEQWPVPGCWIQLLSCYHRWCLGQQAPAQTISGHVCSQGYSHHVVWVFGREGQFTSLLQSQEVYQALVI